MDKYIYDENNGLWYELQGDYYIPCLTIPEEEQLPIGLARLPGKLVFVEYLLSLRASAHTGVAIPRLKGNR